MSLLNTLKLTSALLAMGSAGLAMISPAFDIGIFLSGFVLGWFLFMVVEGAS